MSTNRHNNPTLRTNLNHTAHPSHHLMEGRNQLMALQQVPHLMEEPKKVMASSRISMPVLLISNQLTAPHQALSNHLLEEFKTKIPTDLIKEPRLCSNTRRLQVIRQQELQDMVALLLAIFHSRNTSTFKVCTMLNIQAACMAIAAFPHQQAPIHTKARTHPSNHNMAHLRTNTADSRDGDLTIVLGWRGEKSDGYFWVGFCIY
jgi:hypothetical protein